MDRMPIARFGKHMFLFKVHAIEGNHVVSKIEVVVGDGEPVH